MVLAALLIIFAIVSHFKPTLAVGLILALLPTYLVRFQFQNIPTTFLELLILVFIVVVFLNNFKNLSDLKSLKHLNWLALLFVVSGVISVVVAPEKRIALGILKAFIVEPVLFFYAVRLVVKKPTDLVLPLYLLFLSSVVISLYGIFQYFTYINLPLRFWGTGEEILRITSVFEYPNALSLYLAPLIAFFMAALVYNENGLNRRNLIFGLVIMITALILTFSRGAWIAIGITTLIILGSKYPGKKTALVAAAIFGFALLLPFTRSRLALIANDASSGARFNLFDAAITEIGKNPFFGNGLGGFRTTLTEQNFSGEILNYPHNIILNFWTEMGILGLLSFLLIVFTSLKIYRQNRNWYTAAACAFLLTLSIHGLVDVPYFKNDLSLLFWFMVSVAAL